jgi:hypothetical protein
MDKTRVSINVRRCMIIWDSFIDLKHDPNEINSMAK